MSTPQQQQVTGKKPWVMNAFAMAAPGHLAPGLWRHPDQEPQTLEHWIELAKKLDEAKFHGMHLLRRRSRYIRCIPRKRPRSFVWSSNPTFGCLVYDSGNGSGHQKYFLWYHCIDVI
ncbi:uncharacterized protein RCC_11395 [Ramularia collo-cygni]|uniref:Uncharacterized protein n=1 Tax=Ramularia collo-cygni TaxID=112498 RepID=A0A2D3VJJ3_9PEZI|nr:uncharacterized protein RCC_11395 [Ramularia collo-cygni]CZT25727.1 uncharacterized protein RCC_11395 [Ramularia collo-cygni]